MFYTRSLENIPTGAPGLAVKTRRIRQLVERAKRDPNFRAKTAELLRNVREKDHGGEIAELVGFVRSRVRYMRDPWSPGGLELFTDARTLLRDALAGKASGDCDDHVILASALLETAGYQTRYTVGATGPEDYKHIWLEVASPAAGGWVPVDLTTKQQEIGWDPSPAYAYTETHTGKGAPMLNGPALPPSFQNTHREPGVYAGSTPSDFYRAVAMRGALPQGNAYALLGQGHELGGFLSDVWGKVTDAVQQYGPIAAGAAASIIGTPALGTVVYGVTSGAQQVYEASKAAKEAANVPMAAQPVVSTGLVSAWPSFEEVKDAWKVTGDVVEKAQAEHAAKYPETAPAAPESATIIPAGSKVAAQAAAAGGGFNPAWIVAGLGLLLLMRR